MSLADEVAALPGGGEFVALWNQVNGNPGEIGDVAERVRSTASKAEESQHRIARTVGEVGDSWHGDAATAFTGYMNHFGAAAGSVQAAMDKAASAITQAATAVTEAQHAVNQAASRILDRAENLAPLKNDPVTLPIYQAGVAQAVDDGVAEAQPQVTRLVQQLEQLATTVRACGQSGGWVAMSETTAGTYLPAKGKPIRWNPVPHGPSGTAPASAGGTAAGGSGAGGTSGGGVSSGGAGSSGGPPAQLPTGNVKTWIEQAKQILIQSGVPASKIDEAGINTIIQHESDGNPHAENDWDSNAAAGHPSKGLMQTIDSTFDAYALPGHKDVWNPVDNIIAGVRYAISRYGSISNVPGVRAVADGGSYVGY